MISEIFSNSVRLSERGIFLGENLLIPITLEKITKKVFYSNTQNAPLITYVCKYRAIIEESLSSTILVSNSLLALPITYHLYIGHLMHKLALWQKPPLRSDKLWLSCAFW